MLSADIDYITLKKPGVTDYAKERNELLRNSKAEWVFFVDTDETISPGLATELRGVTKSKQPLLAYKISRQNYFLGRYVGDDKIIRFGRKNAGSWHRIVHEIWRVNGAIGELKHPLVHHTATNLSEYLEKINKYSSLHAQANKIEGKSPSLFKIVLFPTAKFLVTLVKSKNVVFSIMQSFHSFLSWSKLYFLHS